MTCHDTGRNSEGNFLGITVAGVGKAKEWEPGGIHEGRNCYWR